MMNPAPIFRDRADAGRELARHLADYRGRPDLLVLALPRGGVPVGFEVAGALHARLDILLVRKLGAPKHEELAMGAIASGDIRVINREVVNDLGISSEAMEQAVASEKKELERREREYRGDRPLPDPRGCTVILVDDGLATGSTMEAAVEAVRRQNPARLVVAVPVGTSEACERFREQVDEVVCAATPEPFVAVGVWYEDFSQTTDRQVRELLAASAERPDAPADAEMNHDSGEQQ